MIGVEDLVNAALQAASTGDRQLRSDLVGVLAGLTSPRDVARRDALLADQLQRSLARVWRIGWMPADVHRALSRNLHPRHARLAVMAMAAESSTWPASVAASLDPRWRSQLDVLGVRPGPGLAQSTAWANSQGEYLAEAIDCAIGCVLFLRLLEPLPPICPAPGEAGPARGTPGASCDARILERVRALLAKAESTTFPEEAEALTAKAAELMTRYTIDRAMLEHGDPKAPGKVRLGVDDPYAKAKSLLLDKVASANRCRAVWSDELGFATVLGYEAELEVVELLYTSLLVQATIALTAAGPQIDARGRSHTRSFRQSFLIAYAVRIGTRLQAAAEHGTAAAAEHEASVLPVLAARDEAVDEAFKAAYPGVVYRKLAISNHSGWRAGTAAAELAKMGIRREVDTRA